MRGVWRVLLPALAPLAAQAAPQLYQTGPGEDVVLVRFVNATAAPAAVSSSAGGKALEVGAAGVTAFEAARAGAAVQGQWRQQGRSQPIALAPPVGGQATAVLLERGGALAGVEFLEGAPPFEPARASLAFYNADAGCAQAALHAVGKRATALFERQAPGQSARRAVNPVALTVQVQCAGAPVGGPAELGRLEPGQSYSVILLPASGGVPRVLAVRDSVAP